MFDLTRDELIVLFEWSHRFCENEKLAFSHHAEAVVLDKIASQLERTLVEPFDAQYPRLLQEARLRVLAAYEGRMEPQSWLHDQPSDQT